MKQNQIASQDMSLGKDHMQNKICKFSCSMCSHLCMYRGTWSVWCINHDILLGLPITIYLSTIQIKIQKWPQKASQNLTGELHLGWYCPFSKAALHIHIGLCTRATHPFSGWPQCWPHGQNPTVPTGKSTNKDFYKLDKSSPYSPSSNSSIQGLSLKTCFSTTALRIPW